MKWYYTIIGASIIRGFIFTFCKVNSGDLRVKNSEISYSNFLNYNQIQIFEIYNVFII